MTIEIRDLREDEPFPAPAGATRLGVFFHGAFAGGAWLLVRGERAEAHAEIERAHRGLGLGKMLLGALETRAAAAGARSLALRPDPASFAPYALRKAGYVPEGSTFAKTF